MTQEAVVQATEAIRRGSKSFAAATRLFGRDTRDSVVMLYAWCRHCDDVIDGQVFGYGAVSRDSSSPLEELARLERQTRQAFEAEALQDPIFGALQEVVRRHGIPHRYPLDHLTGFRMDVHGRQYDTIEDLLDYCYHVAGVVGVMMAHVMGVRDPVTLDRACDLGMAFQLTNIARDVLEDAAAGRIYLPRLWLADAGIMPHQIRQSHQRTALAAVVARLLTVAEPYYASAGVGIGALSARSAWAIATARAVYREIGVEVLRRGPLAWDERVSTTRARKLRLMLRGGIEAIRRTPEDARCRQALWTRPR